MNDAKDVQILKEDEKEDVWIFLETVQRPFYIRGEERKGEESYNYVLTFAATIFFTLMNEQRMKWIDYFSYYDYRTYQFDDRYIYIYLWVYEWINDTRYDL